jgi:hypothetical protein
MGTVTSACETRKKKRVKHITFYMQFNKQIGNNLNARFICCSSDGLSILGEFFLMVFWDLVRCSMSISLPTQCEDPRVSQSVNYGCYHQRTTAKGRNYKVNKRLWGTGKRSKDILIVQKSY